MNGRNDSSLTNSKRDILVNDHLLALGITSIEDAPDDLIDEAHEYADSILGKGNNN